MNNLKLLWLAIFVAAASLLGGCGHADDAKWEKALIGTWRHIESEPNGLVVEGQTTYQPDGTMKLTGVIKFQGREQKISVNGKWRIEQGYLRATVEESNIADIIPNGTKTSDKIVSITDKEYTYSDEHTGKTKTEQRVP